MFVQRPSLATRKYVSNKLHMLKMDTVGLQYPVFPTLPSVTRTIRCGRHAHRRLLVRDGVIAKTARRVIDHDEPHRRCQWHCFRSLGRSRGLVRLRRLAGTAASQPGFLHLSKVRENQFLTAINITTSGRTTFCILERKSWRPLRSETVDYELAWIRRCKRECALWRRRSIASRRSSDSCKAERASSCFGRASGTPSNKPSRTGRCEPRAFVPYFARETELRADSGYEAGQVPGRQTRRGQGSFDPERTLSDRRSLAGRSRLLRLVSRSCDEGA
jgi:hypothetical protein